MNAGRGGWVGQHHASLYGPVLTTETWPFFAKLIGEINYKNYISKFASGDVRVEEPTHPVFAGVPAKFNVTTEEWYIWDKDPRPKVHVLANVDENSYKFVDPSQSGTKMGDHPVVWTYDGYKARNLYIFMGHHPNLFHNEAYVTLLRNALFWAANKPAPSALRGRAARVPSVPAGTESGAARNAAGRASPANAATIRFTRP
jgi:type 1 glutamine amidotransferase